MIDNKFKKIKKRHLIPSKVYLFILNLKPNNQMNHKYNIKINKKCSTKRKRKLKILIKMQENIMNNNFKLKRIIKNKIILI